MNECEPNDYFVNQASFVGVLIVLVRILYGTPVDLFALLLFVQAPSISSSVHLRFRSWISLIILNTSALEMRLSESILPAKSEEKSNSPKVKSRKF